MRTVPDARRRRAIASPPALVLAFALAFTMAGQAHHAYSLNYEADDDSVIEGIVEEVLWTNPHAHYYITVERADGSRELWDVETFNLNRLHQMGWDRNSIVVGDRIKVTGYLGRNGVRRIAGRVIEKADGTRLRVAPAPSESGQ